MNERIRALAEQAGYKHPDAVGMCEDYAYFSHEKFAELVVRECGIVADRWVDDEDNGHNLVSERLRQHFGVEE